MVILPSYFNNIYAGVVENAILLAALFCFLLYWELAPSSSIIISDAKIDIADRTMLTKGRFTMATV